MKQRLINRWMDLYPLRGMMATLVFEKEREEFKRIESKLERQMNLKAIATTSVHLAKAVIEEANK